MAGIKIYFLIKIQCFRVKPYKLGEDILLDIEQIIPIKDAEEYVIKMAEKTQIDEKNKDKLAERYEIRLKFWKKHLEYFSQKSDLFNNISPTKDNWLGTGSGISSGSYNFAVSKSYARVELYFSRYEKMENKFIFDSLRNHQYKIEEAFGDSLIWERLDDRKATRIKYQRDGLNLYDEDDWEEMMVFMTENMIKLQSVFDKYIKEARLELIEFIGKEDI